MPKVLLLAWDRVFKIKDALENKQYKPDDTQELFRELFNDVQNIHEELAEYINTLGWNRPAFYNNGNDDDEDCTIAITSDFLITDSLSMGDEHLDTIPEKESDEFIKSSVEDLVPNPSEFEDECECDVPDYDDSQTTNFSTLILFLLSSPVNSFFSNRFHRELMKLIAIPRNTFIFLRDCSTITHLLVHQKNLFLKILMLILNLSFHLLSPNEDSYSFMEEIDLFLTPDDPMSSSIEDDDDESERDILILTELIDNYSLSLTENESFRFDIPSFSRPPAKPPDGNTGILNIKMMGDISDQKVPMPRLTITRVSNQGKSLDLLSHRGPENFQLSAKYPMMIHGKNIPILDVSIFHFTPLINSSMGELGQAQRPKTSASWEAPHAYQ
uniref:Reverse transcriptase domain-containing protein n=1 Tax=Tanacetum cinerariifolium TaxID=118510 RepID=A0A6L2JYL5_TANCI|nr:hypothetical protein [Tanacetum cinerariifolium]